MGSEEAKNNKGKIKIPRPCLATCARHGRGKADFRALFGCSCSSLFALNITQAGSLAAQATQIVELGAPHFRGTNHFQPVDHLGILGEDSLHTLAETDLANGEAGLRAATSANHYAFKRLQALFVTLFDFHMYANGIARSKLR